MAPIETNLYKDPLTIKVAIDGHMSIISAMVKILVDNIFLDRRSNINLIIEIDVKKLEIPRFRSIAYNMKLANSVLVKSLKMIKDLKIRIHWNSCYVTFMVITFKEVKSQYFLLLDRPWLQDAKVKYNRDNNQVIIESVS